MQSTTNQVRQILSNELGLTREAVQEIVTKTVTERVDQFMGSLESSGKLSCIVEEAFERKYRNPKRGYGTFAVLLEEAATEAASKFVEKHICITASKK